MRMNTQNPVTGSESIRDYVLAEFRCATVKAKLAVLDLEAVATALKLGIITPDQAIEMFWNSEAVQFVGLQIGFDGSSAKGGPA
jgi:hypothetical protein